MAFAVIGDYGAFTTTVSTTNVNRFFPSLGNHDVYGPDGAAPYLDYFTLPGNERYYDFTWGPAHLFALNSDFNEPDSVHVNSIQAQWLQERLAASLAPWNLVYLHVPPYSSGHHGSGEWMRWPFREWGADAVLAGHDHHYERLLVDGTPLVSEKGHFLLHKLPEVEATYCTISREKLMVP